MKIKTSNTSVTQTQSCFGTWAFKCGNQPTERERDKMVSTEDRKTAYFMPTILTGFTIEPISAHTNECVDIHIHARTTITAGRTGAGCPWY